MNRSRQPDRVELGGRVSNAGLPGDASGMHGEPNSTNRPFLSVWYRCCHVYGRLYRTTDGTKYAGGCPRCGARVEAGIGPGGTTRRLFEAR